MSSDEEVDTELLGETINLISPEQLSNVVSRIPPPDFGGGNGARRRINNQSTPGSSTGNNSPPVLIATFSTKILGLLTNRPEVSIGDSVTIRRDASANDELSAVAATEPKMVVYHDASGGSPLGHLSSDQSRVFADLIHSKKLNSIKGTIPRGVGNVESMPVILTFHARHRYKELLINELHRKKIAAVECNQDQQHQGNMDFMENDENTKELDNLFKESLALQEKGDLMSPCIAIKTSLYPHQMIALNWMFQRENQNLYPPFWSDTENGQYVDRLTNTLSYHKPQCVSGGILADDMGLGKTLTLISLIMTNFHEGLPMAKPRYGFQRKHVQKIYHKKAIMEEEDEDAMKDKTEVGGLIRKKMEHDKLNNKNSGIPRKDFLKNKIFQFCQKSREEKKEEEEEEEEEEDSDFDFDFPLQPAENIEKSGDDEIVNKKKPVKPLVESDDEEEIENNFNLNLDGNTELPEEKKRKLEKDEGETSTKKPRLNQRHIVPPVEIGYARGRPHQTLIVCPMVLLTHWYRQIDEHVDSQVDIKVFIHHGQGRKATCLEDIKDMDIVITTFGTVARELKEKELGNYDKVILLNNHWLRVILDEGHTVKNPKAQMTKAINEITTDRKWVVTGTPIQNNLTELFSLVHWLGVKRFEDKRNWKELIERTKGTPQGRKRLQILLTTICMRRCKNDRVNGKPIVQLPNRNFSLKEVHMKGKEHTMYKILEDEGIRHIQELIRRRRLLNNYAHVFALLMRLRQFCCHMHLLPLKIREDIELAAEGASVFTDEESDKVLNYGDGLSQATKEELIKILEEKFKEGVDEPCCICLDELDIERSVITACKHPFHQNCCDDLFKSNNSPYCPLCRSPINKAEIAKLPEREDENAAVTEQVDMSDIKVDGEMSAKLKAVFSALSQVPREDKVVIVSQFTSYLNIIQPILRENNYKFTRLDGTMTSSCRNAVLDDFASNPNTKILLLSLKAGGVGLNLVSANHLFLLDPAWNPATEDQCFDRIYRLGQKKDVFITKFIVNETIEDRILDLQAKKKELASGAFSKSISRADARASRISDIQVLINMPTTS